MSKVVMNSPACRCFPLKPFIKGFLLVIGAAPLQAEQLYGSWHWHAFASQGIIHTSDNNFYGKSDDGLSTEFRELGAILGVQPMDDLHLVAQVLSREAGEVDEAALQVDYAFASYTAYSGLDWELGLKAGRLRTPLGFYNDTRDVAHTRPSILLPQSVYPEVFRDLLFARDGIQLFGHYQYGLSTLSWDLSYGRILIDKDYYPELIGRDDLPGRVEKPFTPVARLLWDWDLGRVRLGLTYADFAADYHGGPLSALNSTLAGYNLPADSIGLSDADISFEYTILSAEYNEADWSLIAEYSRIQSDMSDFGLTYSSELEPYIDTLGALLPAGSVPELRYDAVGYGYYIQGIYRFSPGWDAFVRWDAQYMDGSGSKDFTTYTEDVTFGLGWRPDSNWLLRAEWHMVEGTSALSTRENDPQELQKHWNMVLFQISYRI